MIAKPFEDFLLKHLEHYLILRMSWRFLLIPTTQTMLCWF